MVLPQVLLRLLPELVVVLAPDYLATHAWNLLHRLIVRRNDTAAPNARHLTSAHGRAPPCRLNVERKPLLSVPAQLHNEKARRKVCEIGDCDSCPNFNQK